MKPFSVGLVALLLSTGIGCSHLSAIDREARKSKLEVRHSGVQFIKLEDCPRLEGLKRFETALFENNFMRKIEREVKPVTLELVDRYASGDLKFVEFVKTDYMPDENDRGSFFREVRNTYRISTCEEAAGGLYVVLVRYDLEEGDRLLGTRMEEALLATGCKFSALAATQDLGQDSDEVEEELLGYLRGGQCRDYAPSQP